MSIPLTARPKLIYVFIALAVLLNFSGLFVPIMALDAARYAAIAKTMVVRNDYLQLFCDGTDWLDKPHFPFWVTALFFKIFGFTTWAYKLPGILFMLAGAWYTYLLGRKLYNKDIALWAVLILLTAEHIIISNNDVRAEPYLTGLIIASVYHFYMSYTAKSFWQLVAAALFAACAVMTKGVFAIIPIAGAIAGELIIKRDWKNFFHPRWILAAVLVFIFITPELYALYYQFDLHPEKIVFDQKNVSGIKFFFWDSQFGRFFNTGPIKGEGDPLFFVHTTLWAFLPWSLIFFAALFHFFKRNKGTIRAEWLCISGSLLTFILFSASSFQLPHYLNIVFPFFAIITAQYFFRIGDRTIRHIRNTQFIVFTLLLSSALAVHILFQPGKTGLSIVILLVASTLIFLIPFRHLQSREKIFFLTAAISVAINLYLNLVFYPALMKYQSGSEAAFWINKYENKLPVASSVSSYPLEFYLEHPLILTAPGSLPPGPLLLYTSEDDLNSLLEKGYRLQVLKSFNEFPITRLDMEFINKNTRNKVVKKMHVVLKSD